MSEDFKRPEWMSSITANVDLDEYLSGRAIDKTFELSQQEKAERAKEARANLIALDKLKLTADPLLELEKRREQLKFEIVSNPIRLRKFRERLIEERSRKHGTSYDVSKECNKTNDRRSRSHTKSPSPTRKVSDNRQHKQYHQHHHRHHSHNYRRDDHHSRNHQDRLSRRDHERSHRHDSSSKRSSSRDKVHRRERYGRSKSRDRKVHDDSRNHRMHHENSPRRHQDRERVHRR